MSEMGDPAESPRQSARYLMPRQPKKRDFSAINKILKSALSQAGLAGGLAKYEFIRRWPSIVGDAIAERAVPEAIKDGVLIVRVSDAAWCQELSFRKDILLKRLHRMFPEHVVVKDVRFYVK